MIIKDSEFGEVQVRRNSFSKNIKFSVNTSGRLQMSVPKNCSTFLAKRFLNLNRTRIRDQLPVRDPKAQRARDFEEKMLRKQAKEYLPYRLDYFANLYGYHFDRLRLSHANTRWGSCSSNGTISLNIGLMKLPESLRDYVILHELAHLHHMDHSKSFWAEVGTHDKNYKTHDQLLKNYDPGV